MFPSPKLEPSPFSNSNRRFANQSFRRLAKRSIEVGLLFTDDQFKHCDRIVYQTPQFRSRFNIGKVLWKRPKQFLEENNYDFKPSLVPVIRDLNHLFVGQSPNTWLVAAALAIAQHRSLFEQLINIDEQNFFENGIVKFTIWQMGIWHKVVIDDRLPSINSVPLFTRPLWTCSSWWVPMLEKAYAKLFGSYEAMIVNGSLHSALIDFSGGFVEAIDPSKFSSEDIWNLIYKEFQAKSSLIFKTKEFKPASSAPFGLFSNRYYLIRNIKKPMGILKRILSNSTRCNDNLPLLITNTIVDITKNSKSNPKKGLQEFWILSNNISALFDSLTICRPYQYNKDHIHRLIVKKPVDGGLQFSFDVHLPNNSIEDVNIHFNLIQKNSPIMPIGFRIYAIELNRKFKIHDFSSIQLVITVDPIQSRNLISSIRLSHGRYLLKPICPEITALLVSIYSPQVQNFCQLTMDMPRYQLLSFMTPVYPSAVTRITVFGVEGLEKQDRFGTANPYCIIRCGRKFIKSSIQYETLMPSWKNFSAIFYHKDKIKPIWIEIWHRSILVDYFIGAVTFKPEIISSVENDVPNQMYINEKTKVWSSVNQDGKCENEKNIKRELSQKNFSNMIKLNEIVDTLSNKVNHLEHSNFLDNLHCDQNILRLKLTDKKTQTQNLGFVLLHTETVEDSTYF